MQDLVPMAARVAGALRSRGETLAIAESSAGGLISAALLAQPGASAFFLGGVVVYTAAARLALLGITPADMASVRPSSEPYASLLAQRVRERLGATWGVGESGAAGPDGNRYGDAPGHSCIAVSGPSETVHTLETGSLDRAANMRLFASGILRLVSEALLQPVRGG